MYDTSFLDLPDHLIDDIVRAAERDCIYRGGKAFRLRRNNVVAHLRLSCKHLRYTLPVDSTTIHVRGSFVDHPSFIAHIRMRALLVHLDEPFNSGIYKLVHAFRVGSLFPRYLFCDVEHVELRLSRSGAWTFSVHNAVNDLLHELQLLCPNASLLTLNGCGSHLARNAKKGVLGMEFLNQGAWHA